jgi:hypothetical protein
MSVQDRHKLSCPTKVVFGPSSFPLNWESVGGEKEGAIKEVLFVIEKEELWGIHLQWL